MYKNNKLIPYENEIIKLRNDGNTYNKIADYLLDKYGIIIETSTICSFYNKIKELKA